ncbi:hypothetical protein EVAR_85833_1 [Eumeta japonica]|uniref:Uncharacterized protein n=1 Tax=Eumeta variegata TaxID=151549 RepID=A0A4C1US38_EUMVA|nr:hypothetical protein EVAR_85833_1 [Eumeta japonica]
MLEEPQKTIDDFQDFKVNEDKNNDRSRIRKWVDPRWMKYKKAISQRGCLHRERIADFELQARRNRADVAPDELTVRSYRSSRVHCYTADSWLTTDAGFQSAIQFQS